VDVYFTLTGFSMAEEIRDLIEKINQEGIKAAEEKAQKIEAAAKQRADGIKGEIHLSLSHEGEYAMAIAVLESGQ
jgi:phosphopantetheinyl transferase (holo-ACP synthase)